MFWTRAPDPAAEVLLDVGTDPELTTGVTTYTASAPAGMDGTVKVDIGGLNAATTYYYRFRQGQAKSLTGSVRTAPAQDDATATVRVGWAGDIDAFFRPFTTLDVLRREALDAWFLIGDTIYGDDPRADGVTAVTVDEYFAKYRANRGDAALRNLMRSIGTYAQWDDHEVFNDFSGAVPAFATQMAAGNLAFRRYHPVREDASDPMRLYRSFRLGAAAEFFLLDLRQYKSAEIVCCNPPDPPIKVIETPPALFGECPAGGQQLFPDATCAAALADPSRTVLGVAQKAWLKNGLLSSTATFKLIMNGPPIMELLLQPYDRWEAYPVERAEILDFIETNAIDNVIWLSTDLHAIVISPKHVDIEPSHFVPEVVSGPVGVESIFRQIVLLNPGVIPLVPAFPALLPQVTDFDLDRFNVVVATIEPAASPPTTRLDFLDGTGAVVRSVTFSASP